MTDEQTQQRIRDVLQPLMSNPIGSARMERKSGLSIPTLRAIAQSGRISRAQTAARLAHATDGKITMDMVASDARGKTLYSSPYGALILSLAITDGVTVSQKLRKLNIAKMDLWTYANRPTPKYSAAKNRVTEALRAAGIDVEKYQ